MLKPDEWLETEIDHLMTVMKLSIIFPKERLCRKATVSRRSTGKTLYFMDEPTTGLHFADVKQLMEVIQRLVDTGNSVVMIEHNLVVIKQADWILDLGPEGGTRGGEIIAQGRPEDIVKVKASHTGRYLKPYLASR